MESEDEDYQSEINKFMKLMFRKFKEFLKHAKETSRFQKKVKKVPRLFLHVINAERNGT